MARPSKEHTYLTQSICFIQWPIYGIVMPWLACFFRASSSKTCTIHTSHIGKVKLVKPTAGEKIHPCQVCKANLSVSSGDPLTCLLLYELFPYLSREYYYSRGHFSSN